MGMHDSKINPSERTKEPHTTSTGKTPPTDPLTRRERRAVLIAAAVLVAVIAVGATVWAVIDGGSDSGQSGDKCVTVAMASSMGGAVEHACGKTAHDWCMAAYAQHDVHAQAVQVQCRGAGILP
jgi:predicted metal-binding membrane protein